MTSGRPPAYGRRDVWERRALYALVVVLVVLIMFPFAWLLTMSFKTDQDIFAFPPGRKPLLPPR